MTVKIASITCMLLLICIIGCGPKGPERVIVKGTVTYRGEPLESGSIRFIPPEGSKVAVNAANIKDGKYVVGSRGGVVTGTSRVEITAYRAVNPQAAQAAARMGEGPPMIQFLPKKYNTDSQLSITIEPGSAEIVQDYELHE